MAGLGQMLVDLSAQEEDPKHSEAEAMMAGAVFKKDIILQMYSDYSS